MKENKQKRNSNWGGLRLKSKLIKKYADQWCRDNGYPIEKKLGLFNNKKGGNYE